MIKKLVLLLYLCCSFTGIISIISNDDKATLALMREEEKLARDVYLTLDDKWDQMVFQHIAQAEVVHMQTVKNQMDKYHVEDPVLRTKDARGKFVNQRFQQLYDSLVTTGSASLEGAFRAGAFVEERDLQDLYDASKATKSEDLKDMYAYLIGASEQHLRAFTRNLKRVGADYKPGILPQEKYDQIIGTGGGPGRGRGMGPGRGGAVNNGDECPPGCPNRKAGCFQEQ